MAAVTGTVLPVPHMAAGGAGAADAAAAGALRVSKFSEEVVEGVTVHFHVIAFDGGAYVWAARGDALESLAVAIPTRWCPPHRPCSSAPPSSSSRENRVRVHDLA